jgi:hypothetical protein
VPAATGSSRQHRAWFPAPFGPFQAWFPGIQLSRDFERVKVPGSTMKSRFVLLSFRGQIVSITICARRRPNHVKQLMSGLTNLLKENFHLLGSPPGDPRVGRCSHFPVRFLPPRFLGFVRRPESAPGADMGIAARQIASSAL